MTKRDVAAVAAGRLYLADWLSKAHEHGTIYYVIQSVSRSGMSRQIRLYTIARRDGGPAIVHLWPAAPEDYPANRYSEDIDAIARDWGFSFDKRAFVVGGCGMDMVFALIDSLAHKAGVAGAGRSSYANSVRRDGL